MRLFFELILRALGEITVSQNKYDKKGRPFLSCKFEASTWGKTKWLKSLVVYHSQEKGVMSLMTNWGARRADDAREFPGSTTLVLKRVNSECWVILHKGQFAGFADQREIDMILAAASRS